MIDYDLLMERRSAPALERGEGGTRRERDERG
jgi:hypothetical protein